MKKICSYIVCICMLFGMISTAFAYTDVTEDYDWANDAITALSENGTINGYPDGTYLPENNVTRAELTKMVCLLFGYGKAVAYADVSETDWYYNFVSQSGGYFKESDHFSPNRPATREEVAYAVYSAMQLTQLPTDKKISFSDQEEVDSFYLAEVKFLNEQGVITGYPDESFRPKNPVTRAEAAVILYRGLQMKNTVPTPTAEPEEESVKALNYFFLVSKISTVLDENDEIVTKVVGYNEGKQEELLLNENVRIQYSNLASGTNLKPGDLIVFTRDFFGTIRTVSVEVNANHLPQSYGIGLIKYSSTAKRQVLYGNVVKRYQDRGIELLATDHSVQNVYSLAEDVNVYLWKNGKLELSDLYEITDSTYETGDTIIAYCYEDEISEILIIR
ncbi:MAG: S-layer homology domain-containing protein [Clostridia bacterium]|nr:S-layer homology domain-containing protein [Clostridia bacterium]